MSKYKITGIIYIHIGRERQTDTDTDRQTDRQTDRGRDRDKERQRGTETERKEEF